MSSKNILLPALTAILCLSGCSETHFLHVLNTSSSSESIPLVSLNRSYSEVEDLMIEWSEIFDKNLDHYFVYIFASWCSHCNSIKNEIIDIALGRNDFFFVNEPTGEASFGDDVASTIGLTSVAGLVIMGYPTLLEIDSHKIKQNISSAQSIVDYVR